MGRIRDAVEIDRQVSPLPPDVMAEVMALAEDALAVDGHPPFSDQTLVDIRDTGRARVILARAERGALAGVAVLIETPDPLTDQMLTSAEVVVAPARRKQGLGTRLLREALGATRYWPFRIWAHGDHPSAAGLAHTLDFDRIRELWRMARPAGAATATGYARSLPPRLSIRTFVPGQDERAWLEVNRLAFSTHPEQGSWSETDLVSRESEPWFDPNGFFLAVDENDTIIGYLWTKVHPVLPASAGHPAVASAGEIYVLAVHPDFQGMHLGAALTEVGLEHLRGLGLAEIILYVESDNEAAVGLYRSQGFEVSSVDVVYERDEWRA